ncbi:hypothetical protein JXA32_02715 [Candidatus Sumerlaeota bacterium]|nr:hypothetical protein [Candidatus Sumerlaeota bacterium]
MNIIRCMIRQFRQDLRRQMIRLHIQKKFPSCCIEDNVDIKGDLDNLMLGDHVIIQFGSVLHLGGMEWCDHSGSLAIGDNGVISPNCVIYACGPGGIEIGRNFDCGPGVGIFASRTDYTERFDRHIFAPVRIGDDVTIFANAVISPGVAIGNGAVIAAGAVVTKDVPENVLVGGTPANVLRKNVKTHFDKQ